MNCSTTLFQTPSFGHFYPPPVLLGFQAAVLPTSPPSPRILVPNEFVPYVATFQNAISSVRAVLSTDIKQLNCIVIIFDDLKIHTRKKYLLICTASSLLYFAANGYVIFLSVTYEINMFNANNTSDTKIKNQRLLQFKCWF
jgi:hypothetical protein